MKKVFILVALAILSLACQKKEIDDNTVNADVNTDAIADDNTNANSDAPVFYASFDDTKAGFNYDSGEKHYSHYWDLNDEVAIFPKGSKYDQYKVTNASSGVLELVAAHVGEHNIEDRGAYVHNLAVYPYSSAYYEAVTFNDRIYLNFPADSPEFDSSSPVYGYENLLLAGSEDNHLTFTSYVGWLKLSLKGDFAIKNIKITGNDNENLTAGGMQFTYYTGSHTFGYLGAGSLTKYRNLRFKSPYPTLSTSSYTDFYIAIPFNITLSKGYTLVITKDDDTTVTLTNNASTKIQWNKVTPTSPISVSDYEAVSSAISFGSETANCYVVPAAGSYRFRAVKGNSATSVGSVASVSVLWETDNTYTPVSVGDIIESVNYYPSFNSVVFSTPVVFKEGNALIAVKDSEDNILWSWHIWCTDTPEDVALSYGGQNTTFMDRNLGALSATKGDGLITHGLYYFWGRKDPFYLSNANFSRSEFLRVQGTITLPTASYADAAKGTVEYITAHPTEIVSAGDSYSKPWFAETPATAWWSNTKTIYDPCPPGYVTYNNNTTSTNIFRLLQDAGGMFTFGGTGTFYYITITDGTNSIWLPSAGRSTAAATPSLYSRKLETDKYDSCYWLGPNNGTYNGQSYYFSFYIDPTNLESISTQALLGTVGAYQMYPVRCQKQ